MLCPHCLKEIHFGPSEKPLFIYGGEPILAHTCVGGTCPACVGVIFLHWTHNPGKSHLYHVAENVVWPKRAQPLPVSAHVPKEHADVFDEARAVLEISPKSSAALSRRLLQTILHGHFSIKKRNLCDEIQDFNTLLSPPAPLREQLDAIRHVGNFAAHPLKDTSTGQVIDVEEGEAQHLLSVLQDLFDFAYVKPAKWSAEKGALNAKLVAAGKPPIQ
jgi:hypothetical protein